MALDPKVTEQIVASIQRIGYDLVRISLRDAGRKQNLQIMIERLDEAPITVEDCAEVSGVISAWLDVEDPIPGEYDLEVSSPGIDRPLTRLKDFTRYKGLEVSVTTAAPVQGRKRFKGILQGAEGEQITVALPASEQGGNVVIEFSNIATAKLVMNDALLKMHEQDN